MAYYGYDPWHYGAMRVGIMQQGSANISNNLQSLAKNIGNIIETGRQQYAADAFLYNQAKSAKTALAKGMDLLARYDPEYAEQIRRENATTAAELIPNPPATTKDRTKLAQYMDITTKNLNSIWYRLALREDIPTAEIAEALGISGLTEETRTAVRNALLRTRAKQVGAAWLQTAGAQTQPQQPSVAAPPTTTPAQSGITLQPPIGGAATSTQQPVQQLAQEPVPAQAPTITLAPPSATAPATTSELEYTPTDIQVARMATMGFTPEETKPYADLHQRGTSVAAALSRTQAITERERAKEAGIQSRFEMKYQLDHDKLNAAKNQAAALLNLRWAELGARERDNKIEAAQTLLKQLDLPTLQWQHERLDEHQKSITAEIEKLKTLNLDKAAEREKLAELKLRQRDLAKKDEELSAAIATAKLLQEKIAAYAATNRNSNIPVPASPTGPSTRPSGEPGAIEQLQIRARAGDIQAQTYLKSRGIAW